MGNLLWGSGGKYKLMLKVLYMYCKYTIHLAVYNVYLHNKIQSP